MPETRPFNAARALRGDQESVRKLLEFPGALIRGHFALLAGSHTDQFFAFSRIAQSTAALGRIADWLEPDVARAAPSCVLSPSTAGVSLGSVLARRLNLPLHLAAVDDRARAESIIGQPDLSGHAVLLVNDVVTTGHGFERLAEVAETAGARLAGAAWFLSRADVDVTAILGVPAFPVARMDLPVWAASHCRLCETGDEADLALDLN